jgi:hypothetical protein
MNTQMTALHVSVAATAIALLSLCTSTGCVAHYATVDGYDAEYVGAPPANIEVYPRYQMADGYVYEVNGRYYHRHGDRWVVYRHAPPEVLRQHRRACTSRAWGVAMNATIESDPYLDILDIPVDFPANSFE